MVPHHNGFNAVAVCHAQQVLHRAVFCLLAAFDLRRGEIELLLQLT